MSRKLRRFQRPLTPSAPKLKVLQIASEVVPFAKTGGLGDVVAALPRALKPHDIETVIVVPRYRSIDPSAFALAKRLTRVEVRFGKGTDTAEVWEGRTTGGIRVFLLDNPGLFLRDEVYGDYSDNPARFAFLCFGALDLVKKLGWRPELVHCHDWQGGLVPYYLKQKRDPFFEATKSIFTIHNLSFQGIFPKQWVEWLDLGWEGFHMGGFEFYDQLNFLKAGVAYADQITTVSPRYAEEIKTPEGGFQLDGLLRSRADHLTGILNGIDTEEWNPLTDQSIAQNFGPDDLRGRRSCKSELQRIFKLPVRETRPVIGVISRITRQKGVDLILAALDRILALGFQIVFLLSGDEDDLRGRFEEAARAHPDRVGVRIGMDEVLARRILAGADFTLIPSRYEPCGLTQLEALRYGAVPVASAVGGLVDTIEEASLPGSSGTGFLFSPPGVEAMLSALERAQKAYSDSWAFRFLQRRGMLKDFSWHRSALVYRDIYYRLAGREIPQEEPLPNGSGSWPSPPLEKGSET